MEKAGFVRIGKILKAHGLKGALKAFAYGETLLAVDAETCLTAVDENGCEKLLTINWVRPGGRTETLAFAGVESRDQAEALVGCELYIDEAKLPALASGTYYWYEIIGLDVLGTDDAYIGRVVSIIPTGGNDVYVVRNGKNETLIPALDWVVVSVDPDAGTMRVDLPEGL